MKTQNNLSDELLSIRKSNHRILLVIIGLVAAILIVKSGLAFMLV